jgi:ABC-type transport system substrate-binding protein
MKAIGRATRSNRTGGSDGTSVLGGRSGRRPGGGSAGDSRRGAKIRRYTDLHVPADLPPSFDAQREETYATIHSAAPFYSVLIRINPSNPASTTDIVCDLCTELPQPTDGGKTYTFKIRDDVKFHNGDELTSEDVAASLNKIAFPPEGVASPRSATFMMVDKIAATDPHSVVIHLKFATSAFLPALADPYNWIYQKKMLDKDPHCEHVAAAVSVACCADLTTYE